MLFQDLPIKSIIISRIKDLPVSARTAERRIMEMATDVKEQPGVASNVANIFSVALDESADTNNIHV